MADARTKAVQPARKWLVWLVLALLWAGGATVGLIGAIGVHSVGSCVNTVLSQRDGPNDADRQAQDVLQSAQYTLNNREIIDVPILVAGTAAQRAKAGRDLQTALQRQAIAYRNYKAARAADDSLRAQHPIGRC